MTKFIEDYKELNRIYIDILKQRTMKIDKN